MADHFADFNKRQKEAYAVQALVKFEESLRPLISQLIQVFAGADFDEKLPVIKALAKRSAHYYQVLDDDAGAADREKLATEEGEKWVKGLSAIAIEGMKSANPEFKRIYGA